LERTRADEKTWDAFIKGISPNFSARPYHIRLNSSEFSPRLLPEARSKMGLTSIAGGAIIVAVQGRLAQLVRALR
jgi:hypothetical protein